MLEILQKKLPNPPWMLPQTRRLPGVMPMEKGDWIRIDDAYGAQMAERQRLVDTQFTDIFATCEGSDAACTEVLERILLELETTSGFSRQGDVITCPDGREVVLDYSNPLLTAGLLVQDDLCVLEKKGDEYDLTAAILCFPASWSLAEKIGKPMMAIHAPVASYTPDIGKRVSRMFDAIHVDRPLWRANGLLYQDPTLFQPRTMAARRQRPDDDAAFIRSERQCFIRLPKSGAVLFSIHTYVLRQSDLTADQQKLLAEFPIEHVELE
ncbi:MAG: DUF3445 domain-containing protein [Paracoccaceae bacterium]|nr:DUF3445 domain-containing protein [Paracoccaceae bacterium]